MGNYQEMSVSKYARSVQTSLILTIGSYLVEFSWLRYITGWLLVGVGTVLLFFGMLKGSTIRVWRGQADAPGDGGPDPKPIAVKKAWGELRGHITSMMVGGGSLHNDVFSQRWR